MSGRPVWDLLAIILAFVALAVTCDTARCEETRSASQSVSIRDSLSYSQYVEAAREKILKAWSKNSAASSAKQSTVVSCTVSKSGLVSQLSIKTSSGNSHQDYAAIETIIGVELAPFSEVADTITLDVKIGSLNGR
jgi:hypothetical protein